MKKDTILVATGRNKKYTGTAVNPRIVRASTIVFDSMSEMAKAGSQQAYLFDGDSNASEYYGRRGTSTTFAFNDAMCELENAAGSYVYPCGTAAITSGLLSFLSAGDHLLMVDSVYQPTRDFCRGTLARMGVEVSYYDPMIGGDINALVRKNTRVIFLESPGSLTMEVQDVPSIVEAAKQHDIVTMIDNTFATPFNFKPLDFGVDISIQSATKYINGHSDVMLGVASANQRHWPQLRDRSYELGQCASVDDIYTALRGIRTLGVRMREHDRNAMTVARWLEQHDLVERLLHPAFESCPGHEFFKRDFSGGNGLFSFVLNNSNARAVAAMVDNMRHFKMGFSWGGYESLILPIGSAPAQRSVAPWLLDRRLIRLHIGLEDTQDLIDDLSGGLERLREAL
ncbi:MAG: cystathionine beta-lyase [Arenicella sp.]|nr:cystathionine beta-lyase [Arenicella sp.]